MASTAPYAVEPYASVAFSSAICLNRDCSQRLCHLEKSLEVQVENHRPATALNLAPPYRNFLSSHCDNGTVAGKSYWC